MQIVNPTPSAMYTGIANAATQISSTEGARSLWRGIASVALGAGMYSAVMPLCCGLNRRLTLTINWGYRASSCCIFRYLRVCKAEVRGE